jgi:hypothetical protein
VREYLLLLLSVLEYFGCNVGPHVHLVVEVGQDDDTAVVVADEVWDGFEHDCRETATTAITLHDLDYQTEHILTVSVKYEVTHDTILQFNERGRLFCLQCLFHALILTPV